MTSRQIECALELARTLNFTKAAENVFISQPSFSYQIQTLEEEIGFTLFYRSGKGATLTPAGKEFCERLSKIHDEIKKAIESGKNFSSKYTDSISVSVPLRSAVYYLPQIMKEFQNEFKEIKIDVKFVYGQERIDDFLRGNTDIVFGLKAGFTHIPQITIHHLFESHIYLVTQKKDLLARKKIITPEHLKGRNLMVGGGSPLELKKAQDFVLSKIPLETFNSKDHFTTLTNIAAGNGICLVPGFCNDHTGEFAWIPVSFDEPISCVFATRADDNRKTILRFIEIAREIYKNADVEL